MPVSRTIAIDTGGTFTDVVAYDASGATTRLKLPSTPDAPWRAVESALETLGGAAEGDAIRHGSTVATNALLERRGARVLLVATRGLEDVLRLGRQARPDLYALHPEVPEPLVEPDDCVGIAGRLGPDGDEVEPLEPIEAWVTRHQARLAGAEAIAICLLHAYANPSHEARVAEVLRQRFPDAPVTVSHELVPVSREYERTSSVAVNAYVAPIMRRYLEALARSVRPASLTIMGSAGGLMPVARAAIEPVHTVLSGPAGGVRGAWSVGARCHRSALLSLDMGGTSTDISVVRGELAPEEDGRIAEHPLRIPLLPIETIGAGGGSIAWIDEAGALRVGPRSAGAVPGPAAYGRGGTTATLTDAHAVLGRLPQLLGGEMTLHHEAARDAVARLADRLGTGIEETAAAVLAVVEANMARACKRVTMERGIDPRDLTLVAFGGAGGLHACALADALGCRDVIFPAEPGVLSAEGILAAPHEAAASSSLFLDETAWQSRPLAQLLAGCLADAGERLRAQHGGGVTETQAFADCRYHGQTFTLAVPLEALLAGDADDLPRDLRRSFDAMHEQRYGYALEAERPVEIVAVRAYARQFGSAGTSSATTQTRRTMHGPTVVPAYSATLWLPRGWQAEVVASGDLLCRRTGEIAKTQPEAEPLALEVHRQRLAAVAEEMGAALMRAAFSANIKERRDFSCAIFDGRGRMLVQAAHLPVHLGSQPMSVAAAIERVPMRPGISVILNDPYAGGTHLPDVTLVSPVYLSRSAKEPAFYAANRAHHADIGGIQPGSMPSPRDLDGNVRSLEISDEGWRSPPVVLNDEVRRSLCDASRTPDERLGDLRAQEAANTVGARRAIEMVESLGPETLASLNDAVLDYSERRMRAIIETLPDGEYRFEDALDDDGVQQAPVPIPVILRIRGSEAIVDFSAAPDAVPGSMNAVRAIAVAAAAYVFRCFGGADVPANAGLMRPITVVTRDGSICNALAPAAVSAGNVETSQRFVDAIYGALAQAAPGRVPAASGGTMNNVLFGGLDPRPGPHQGRPFVHYETLAVGAGGSASGPGASGVHTHMTNTLNTPIEELERLFPVRIARYALRPVAASEPGEVPGGAGIVRAYTFLAEAEVTLVTERRRLQPWGLGGAADGAPGRNRVRRANGSVEELPGKIALRVAPGDTVIVETPGGGSWRLPKG